MSVEDYFDFGLNPEDGDERDSGYYDNVKLISQTKKAYLVRFERNFNPHWVPKTQVISTSLDQVGDLGHIEVTSWIVDKWTEEGFDPNEATEEPSVSIPNVVCLRESDKAIWCKLPSGRREWFPKGYVLPTSEVKADGDVGMLVVAEWLMKDKDLQAKEPKRDTLQSDLEDVKVTPDDGDDPLPF